MHLPIVETKKLDKWIFAYANKDFPIADEIYSHIIQQGKKLYMDIKEPVWVEI